MKFDSTRSKRYGAHVVISRWASVSFSLLAAPLARSATAAAARPLFGARRGPNLNHDADAISTRINSQCATLSLSPSPFRRPSDGSHVPNSRGPLFTNHLLPVCTVARLFSFFYYSTPVKLDIVLLAIIAFPGTTKIPPFVRSDRYRSPPFLFYFIFI